MNTLTTSLLSAAYCDIDTALFHQYLLVICVAALAVAVYLHMHMLSIPFPICSLLRHVGSIFSQYFHVVCITGLIK